MPPPPPRLERVLNVIAPPRHTQHCYINVAFFMGCVKVSASFLVQPSAARLSAFVCALLSPGPPAVSVARGHRWHTAAV